MFALAARSLSELVPVAWSFQLQIKIRFQMKFQSTSLEWLFVVIRCLPIDEPYDSINSSCMVNPAERPRQ